MGGCNARWLPQHHAANLAIGGALATLVHTAASQGILACSVDVLCAPPEKAHSRSAAKPCASLQELGRFLWAFASTGRMSEEVATVLKTQEAASEGANAEALQQVAAAYCTLPALAKRIPQSLLVQAVKARSHQVASSATSQVNSTALDNGA